MRFKASRYLLDISIPRYETVPEADRLLFSQRTGRILRLSRKYLDLLYAGEISLLPFRLFCLLFDGEMLVPEDEDEESVIVTRKELEKEDRGSHSATLLVPVKGLPDDPFWDDLSFRLHDTLNSFPHNKIQGRDYQLHLLTVLETLPPPPDWFAELDLRMPQPGMGSRTSFTIQLACHISVLEQLVLPPLRKLTMNKLIVVFNGKANVQYEPAVLVPIESYLADTATYPGLKVQIVFECGNNSWENWKEPFVRSLASLSGNGRLTLEFVPDAGDAADLQQERALMDFLRTSGIKSKWLPRPRRLCAEKGLASTEKGTTEKGLAMMENGLAIPVREHTIRVLNAEQHWDADEILQLPGLTTALPCAGTPLPFPRIRFEHTLKERVLTTAGIALK